ncbi:hypothetical protein [Ancylobacter sp.]|uniref:hypothetical protein n=1 Tax=Ancylobacter sp. TaxID=1872567 RepID=UPI003D12EB53
MFSASACAVRGSEPGDCPREAGQPGRKIAENLHRAELTALERDEQVALWVKLNAERQSAQSEPIESKRGDGKGHRPESGVRAAARELGIEKEDARRATKVASLSDEAKEAAREAGLDDNRSGP